MDNGRKRFRRTAGAYSMISQKEHRLYRKITGSKISYSDYAEILNDHVEQITNKIVEDRDGVKLGRSIAAIFVASYKPFKAKKDYHLSKLYNKDIKLLNLDTNGLIAKIIFTTHILNFKNDNKSVWAFKAAKKFTTKVSKTFKQNYNYYKQINFDDKVWKSIEK